MPETVKLFPEKLPKKPLILDGKMMKFQFLGGLLSSKKNRVNDKLNQLHMGQSAEGKNVLGIWKMMLPDPGRSKKIPKIRDPAGFQQRTQIRPGSHFGGLGELLMRVEPTLVAQSSGTTEGPTRALAWPPLWSAFNTCKAEGRKGSARRRTFLV